MILSVSRRTDIPALYASWFFRRWEVGEVWVRNPMNPRRIMQIDLRDAEGIVFWTKNPLPMIERLGELGNLPFYFQFTLTPYGRDWEPGLPHKRQVLLPAFQTFSRQLGSERVLWRYDPILLDPVWTVERHIETFSRMASLLEGYTPTCTISFLDEYRSILPVLKQKQARSPNAQEIQQLAAGFSKIAAEHKISLFTCGEAVDLGEYNILHGKCVDAARLGLESKKAKGQRKLCGCDESVDIGSYHTCSHGCRYCYACRPGQKIYQSANPDSPMLLDAPRDGDVVYPRARERILPPEQTRLFP